MTGTAGLPNHWHTCHHCNKRAYHSRKAAQTVRRGHRGRNTDHNSLAVYRCPHDNHTWHLGHQPTSIARGAETRHEYLARHHGDHL